MTKYGARFMYDPLIPWDAFVEEALDRVRDTLNNRLETDEFTITVTEYRDGEIV